MIYDCFQFFNELDLLSLRLNVLDPIVDMFVISESTVTFSGQPKPLYYKDNKELFQKFNHKIIHNIVDDTPNVNPFERDGFQKCAVKRGLLDCEDSDIIIFSDLDEIPNPKKLLDIFSNFQKDKIYHLAQRMFYFYINLEEISGNLISFTGDFDGVLKRNWLGTKVFQFSFLNAYTLGQMRFPDRKNGGIRVSDGGWHFGYMGGDKNSTIEERVSHKIKSAAHQEYNNQGVLSKIKENIQDKKDIFGRNTRFVIVGIDETFPEYLVENKDEFSHLILPIKSPGKAKSFWEDEYTRNLNHHSGQNVAITRDFIGCVEGHPKFLNMFKSSTCAVELGCGSGDLCFSLKKTYNLKKVTGLDLSDNAVSSAKSRYPDINFITMDVLKEDLKGIGTYDVCISSNVLEHFKDPYLVIDKCLEVCKFFVALVPYRQPEDYEPIDGGGGHISYFSEESFQKYELLDFFIFITEGWQHSVNGEVPLQLAVMIKGKIK